VRHQVRQLSIQVLQETAIHPVRIPIQGITQLVQEAVVRQYRAVEAALIQRIQTTTAVAVHDHQVLLIRVEVVQVEAVQAVVRALVAHAVHPEVEAVAAEDNLSVSNISKSKQQN